MVGHVVMEIAVGLVHETQKMSYHGKGTILAVAVVLNIPSESHGLEAPVNSTVLLGRQSSHETSLISDIINMCRRR